MKTCRHGTKYTGAGDENPQCAKCRSNISRRKKRNKIPESRPTQNRDMWLSRYYRITAHDQVYSADDSMLACTLHSIRKWQGFGEPGEDPSATCALCIRHSKLVSPNSCRYVGQCLPELNSCLSVGSPWAESVTLIKKEPILSALFKAAFRLMAEDAIKKLGVDDVNNS